MPAPFPVRRDDLVEDLHGVPTPDPYRWLEDLTHPDTRAFVEAANAHSGPILAALPARDAFTATLTRLWDHPRVSPPERHGAVWFQRRNDGLQDQDVLWVAPADGDTPPHELPAGAWRVLVDPNRWTADGTATLAAAVPSPDGRLVACARQDAGSDWQTWQVVEVATGERLDADVSWAKFSSAAWLPDASGFVYGRYPAPPAAGREHEAATRGHQLALHRLGTDPADDEVVHAAPDAPELLHDPTVTHDGRWLVVTSGRGTDPETRVVLRPIRWEGDEDTGRLVVGDARPLRDADTDQTHPVGVVDGRVLCTTTADAPLGRVVAIDPDDPATLHEVVPESGDRLQAAVLVGGGTAGAPGALATVHLHHAASRVTLHDLDGGRPRPVPLDDVAGPLVTAGGLYGEGVGASRDSRLLHLAVESFTAPAAVLVLDVAAPDRPAPAVAWAPDVPPTTPDGTPLEVERVFVRSGTEERPVRVPLFLVHRADVTPDGTRPTVLWGYGGFGIAVTPAYRTAWRAWVEHGGVLAVACLRGGGEYGQPWHDDGRLAAKPNVFADAVACAGWLTGRDGVVAEHLDGTVVSSPAWSSPEHLGVEGRSNGGLLAASLLTQRPDLLASAVPEVGVLDLLRFHRFTIGWAWTSDYGDPEDPHDAAVARAYSPYHRLAPGTAYPATLVTTGDTDDRVVPSHSYKFTAALWEAQGGDAPVALRVDVAAGHGAGKPTSKLVAERADVLAWHAHHTGLEVAPGPG
ncbi:MAG: prolyl oligopeptidase family serine peptidase [Actinomycetes bacterium]